MSGRERASSSRLSRRAFLRGALGVGAASLSRPLLGSASPAPDTTRAPNVLLVIGDDHRYDWMHHSGRSFLATPHLDRLAREGWSFPNAFGCAGVCSPARAALLTGKYPHQASAPSIVWQNNSFLRTQTMFPQLLHDAGYRTGYVGKFHLGEDEKPKPGFDLWASFPFVGNHFDQPLWVNGEKQRQRGFTDDNLAELAAATIELWARSDRPFCLIVGLKAPHIPFRYPRRMEHLYADVVFEPPASFDIDLARARPGLAKNILEARTWHTAIPAYGSFDAWLHAYARTATTVDDSVGRLLAALDSAGAAGDTLVLYTSDQGYSLGELGLCEKHYAYEQVMRVPLLARFPGQPQPGAPPADLVSHVDVAPTILDFCVGGAPADMAGLSWRPLLSGSGPSRPPLRSEVFFDFWHPRDDLLPPMQAVRTNRHKLIDYEYQPLEELYDLAADPQETHDLSGAAAQAPVLDAMRARLAQWKDQTGWSPRTRTAIARAFVAGPLTVDEDARLGAALRAVSAAALLDAADPRWRLSFTEAGVMSWPAEAVNAVVYLALPVERLAAHDPFISIELNGFDPADSATSQPLAFAGFASGERIWTSDAYATREGIGWAADPRSNNGYNPPLFAGRNTIVLRVLVDPATPRSWKLGAVGALGQIRWLA